MCRADSRAMEDDSQRPSTSASTDENQLTSDGFIKHKICKTDTIAGLAIKYNVGALDIKRANGLLTDSGMFALGEVLIPKKQLPLGEEGQVLVSRLLTGVGRDPSLNAFAKTLPGTAATLQYSGERLPRVVSSSGRTSESTFEALGFRLNGGWLCGCDMDAEGMPCSSESCSRLASPANGSSGGSRPWPRAPGEVELMLRNSDGSSWGASADTMRKRGQGPGPALPLPPQHHYHHHRGRGAGPSTRRSLDNSWASPSDRATAHDPWASLDPSRDRPPRPNPLRSILREVGSSAQALAEKVKRAAANPALAVPSSSSSRPGNGFAAAADGVLQALRRGSRSLGPSDAGGTYQPLSTTERVPLSTAGGSSSSSMRSAVKRNSKSD